MHPIEQLRFVARSGGADARSLVEEAASALTAFRHDHRALVMACRRLVGRQPMVAPLWWLCSRLVTTGDVAAEARSIVFEVRNDPTAGSLADHLVAAAGGAASDAGCSAPRRAATMRLAIAGWSEVVVSGIVGAADRERSVEYGVVVMDVDGDGPAVARHLDRVGVEADHVDPARAAVVARSVDLVVVEAAAACRRRFVADAASVALMAAAEAAGTPVWCVVPVGRAVPDVYCDAMMAAAESDAASASSPIEEAGIDLVDTVIVGDVTVTRSVETESWSEALTLALVPVCPVAPELLH